MPNPFDQSLDSMFKVYGQDNPLSYFQGSRMLDQSRDYNLGEMYKQKQGIQADEVMNPLRAQQMELANLGHAYELPGRLADSVGKVRKQEQADLFHDDEINALKTKYKAEELSAKVKELENRGTQFMQWANGITYNPKATRLAAKQQLGEDWDPSWDQLSDPQLSLKFHEWGKGIQDASPKFQQALGLQESKNAAAEKRAAMAAETAQFRAKLIKDAQSAKASKDPTTYQGWAGKLLELARTEEDPGKQAVLLEQAQQFAELYHQSLIARGAAVPRPDLGQMGVPTTPTPEPPKVKVPGANPNVSPSSGSPAQGRRVRVQSPDGKTGTIPADQLQDALSQGYKEIK